MYIFAHIVLLPQVEFLEVELMDYVSVFVLLIPGDSDLHSYQLRVRVLTSSDPQQWIYHLLKPCREKPYLHQEKSKAIHLICHPLSFLSFFLVFPKFKELQELEMVMSTDDSPIMDEAQIHLFAENHPSPRAVFNDLLYCSSSFCQLGTRPKDRPFGCDLIQIAPLN